MNVGDLVRIKSEHYDWRFESISQDFVNKLAIVVNTNYRNLGCIKVRLISNGAVWITGDPERTLVLVSVKKKMNKTFNSIV